MKKTFMIAMAALFLTTSMAEAQYGGQRRPPWGDVCCGGPCCVKPQKPGR